ncbi:MAG: protein-disulfide reductase DsbD domain-containing protein, partial [Planctomycetota bacterium]|nr:protein-disulfide reductase DsbD domain-containing protein [Planctomycetota bacterium]
MRSLPSILFPMVLATLPGTAGPAPGDPPGTLPSSGDDLVEVRVLCDTTNLLPGQSFTIGIEYSIEPGWHIYWRNPGANGLPPEIGITAPEGFEVGDVLYPRPRVFGAGEDASYGYDGEVVLLVPIRAANDLAPGPVDLEFALEWLVCKRVCLVGAATRTLRLDRTLPGRESTTNPAEARLIRSWAQRVPRLIGSPQPRGFFARLDDRQHLLIRGIAGASKDAIYLPGGTPGVAPVQPGPVRGSVTNGRFTFDIPLSVEPENALGQPLR